MKNKNKKGIGLTTRIFISLIIGCIVGLILHYTLPEGNYVRDTVLMNGIFNVVGQGFLRLMQMLVVPLVLCSIVCGSAAIGDTKTLGKVGVKTIAFYVATTALAITVALIVAKIINPGEGLNLESVIVKDTSSSVVKTSITDTLLDIIPTNPFQSLATANMLQIILFALLVGIILAKLGERTTQMQNLFQQGNDIMMELTMMVMKVAPIGVFCLIAKTFIQIGLEGFKPMALYMVSVMASLVIQCCVVYSGMLKIFTGLNPYKFIRKFMPVMGFAFSTATSNATIPLSIDTLYKKVGVSRRISSFTIPLGATINMDGTAIMQGVAVIFISQIYDIPLTFTQLATVVLTATLASIGTAGVPGVGLVTLTMVLNSVGLPIEGIGYIMGIDRILDMSRTAVNITGDAICTTIVAHQDGSLDKDVFYDKKSFGKSAI